MDIRDKDQDGFYCAAVSNTKWRAQIGMCLPLFPNESMKAVAVRCDLLITTYNVLKVCLLIIPSIFVFIKSSKWPSESERRPLITKERDDDGRS